MPAILVSIDAASNSVGLSQFVSCHIRIYCINNYQNVRYGRNVFEMKATMVRGYIVQPNKAVWVAKMRMSAHNLTTDPGLCPVVHMI